ncbi:MAG: transglycosylase SLT domain-containing protein [Candidatus Yanofskybacteria bacterium]|nr:transglycosylase SLT domain-containing protein [Candidatus Yanofskybacteria bacterium]
MKIFYKTLLISASILFVVFLIFQPIYSTNAAGLVPCGQSEDDPATTDVIESNSCTTCDVLVLGSRVINFILFTVTPAIAVLLFLIAGFMILLGGANPGLVTTGKNIFKTTVYGLLLIFGAWMITNTVLKSIAGEGPFTGKWNEVTCAGGGVGGVGGVGGGGGGSGGGGVGGGGGETLACIFNGVDYASFNLCTGQNRPGGCGTSLCSQYSSSIDNYAGGAATAALLKTMMVIESDCNIRAATGSSYGLMQIRPSTANLFRNRCGIPEIVTPGWLINPANADKSICLAAAFINSIAAGSCGAEPRNIYAGYNAGPGNCVQSDDCSGDQSCDGGAVKRWECPYDNSQHTVCNTGFYQTKQGAAYVNYCLDNLGF